MAVSYTTTYNLTKPEVGASEDEWGGLLNTNFDELDNLLDGTTPITGIDINSGTIDGTVIGGATPAAGTFTTLTANTSIGGTLSTAAQPNVTSVGTLTGLTVSGSTSLAGASTSADITFGDNVDANFGASSDLKIFHDAGGTSHIRESGSSHLYIEASNLRLKSSADTGETYLTANLGGDVSLYYDNAAKLATTSTGIDVTGTVTADGLTVDGGNVNNDSNAIAAKINANGNEHIRLEISTDSTIGNQAALDLISNSNTSRIYTTGTSGLNFSTDGGSTSHLTLDGSGNVGIGTSSPSLSTSYDKVLHINSTLGSLIKLTDATSGTTASDGTDLLNYGNDTYLVNRDVGSTIFGIGGVEKMRLDSSGNLLVGKSDTSIAVDGVKIQQSGQIVATQASADVLRLNRKTSDGTIIDLRKDGSTVGSIGTVGGDIVIGSGNTGVRFYEADNSILPSSTAGQASDGALDIGDGSFRWKDLYLSGGVYLGGTGSANKLDDYEEGTWTPTDGSGAGLTFVASGGRFVRIGSVVNFAFRAHYPVTADGSSALIASLPFVGAATTGSFDTAGGWTSLLSENFSTGYLGYVPASSSTLKIVSQSNASVTLTNANVSGNNIYGFGTYYLS